METLELGEAGTGLTKSPGSSSGYQGMNVWAGLYWLLNYFQKDLNSPSSEPWFLPQPLALLIDMPCPAGAGGGCANVRNSGGFRVQV